MDMTNKKGQFQKIVDEYALNEEMDKLIWDYKNLQKRLVFWDGYKAYSNLPESYI